MRHRTRRHRRDGRGIPARRRSPRPAVRPHAAGVDRGPARRRRSDRGAGTRAHRPADVDGPVDVVLLAVKDTQNEQAGAWLARLCDERTVVCALQNGVEQVERVGRYCPRRRWCRPPCGSRRKSSQRAGCGCAPGRGWCCRTPRRPRPLCGDVARRGVTATDPDFAPSSCWSTRGRFMADRRARGCSAATTWPHWPRYLAECLAVARAEGADLGDEVIDEIVGMSRRRRRTSRRRS